jgi:hypothetical protein
MDDVCDYCSVGETGGEMSTACCRSSVDKVRDSSSGLWLLVKVNERWRNENRQATDESMKELLNICRKCLRVVTNSN